MKTKTSEDVTIGLDLTEKTHESFFAFMDQNRNRMYKAIIDLFEQLALTKKESGKLLIRAFIENAEWKTDLKFKIWQYPLLITDLLPHFSSEKIEDYESCQRICDLHKNIKIILNAKLQKQNA